MLARFCLGDPPQEKTITPPPPQKKKSKTSMVVFPLASSPSPAKALGAAGTSTRFGLAPGPSGCQHCRPWGSRRTAFEVELERAPEGRRPCSFYGFPLLFCVAFWEEHFERWPEGLKLSVHLVKEDSNWGLTFFFWRALSWLSDR